MTKSSDQVDKLLAVMDGKEMSVVEMVQRLGPEHRTYFRRNYLDPALEKELIERTIPDKPTSSKQKYRKVKQYREWMVWAGSPPTPSITQCCTDAL